MRRTNRRSSSGEKKKGWEEGLPSQFPKKRGRGGGLYTRAWFKRFCPSERGRGRKKSKIMGGEKTFYLSSISAKRQTLEES